MLALSGPRILHAAEAPYAKQIWRFLKIRGTFVGVPIIGTVLFGVYIGVPLFSEITISQITSSRLINRRGIRVRVPYCTMTVMALKSELESLIQCQYC